MPEALLEQKREKFKNVKIIILDERSMRGLVGMSWTSQWLQQIFNNNDDLPGGVPIIILVGDDGQIGPHGDTR